MILQMATAASGQTKDCTGAEAVARRLVDRGIDPCEIMLDVELRGRRQALEFAGAAFGRMHGLDPEPIIRALWRRELVGSTALGCGIAIPHARIDGITQPATLYLRAKWPIDFAAPDGKLVRHLLALLVPTDGDTEAHLQLLATIAQMATERAFRDRLTSAEDARAIRRTFAEFGSAAGDAVAAEK